MSISRGVAEYYRTKNWKVVLHCRLNDFNKHYDLLEIPEKGIQVLAKKTNRNAFDLVIRKGEEGPEGFDYQEVNIDFYDLQEIVKIAIEKVRLP